MVFSFDSCLSRSRGRGEICLEGSKDPPLQDSAPAGPRPMLLGNKTGCANANNTRTATGLFPVVFLNAVPFGASTSTFAPKRSSARRGRCRAKARPLQVPDSVGRIGRQAPVKRCLARFAGL